MAGELAQKMLAYARGGKYRPQVINLNGNVLEALELEEGSFPPSVAIEHELESDLWPVRADPNQMNQVIMNLSINAVEAIEERSTQEPGGSSDRRRTDALGAPAFQGRILITTRNIEVDADFARQQPGLDAGAYVCVAVEDNGKGMSPDVQARVFEPFFTTKFQGRGLGMAAVYGIVKNHNGAIAVHSEENEGSVLTVYLPAVNAAADDEATDLSATVPVEERRIRRAPLPRGSETILVIDDEEMVLAVARELLEDLGYTVLLAHNGQEAVDLARIREDPIHLSILDLGMPVMGGVQAYPLLMEAQPAMKVVICSGYGLNPAAQGLLDAGADAFVQKPFLAENLVGQIRHVLDS